MPNDDKTSEKKEQEKSRASNWFDLANHFKDKVQKRTSEVSFLQTKAGFIIAASIVILQAASNFDKFQDLGEYLLWWTAILLIFAALILAIISMNFSETTTALDPAKMIKDLEERPLMKRHDFSRWLARSYSKTNARFNREYNSKYRKQIWSAGLLVVAIAILILIKGVHKYG